METQYTLQELIEVKNKNWNDIDSYLKLFFDQTESALSKEIKRIIANSISTLKRELRG